MRFCVQLSFEYISGGGGNEICGNMEIFFVCVWQKCLLATSSLSTSKFWGREKIHNLCLMTYSSEVDVFEHPTLSINISNLLDDLFADSGVMLSDLDFVNLRLEFIE